MFALDATDISKWDTVEALAASVLESVMDGTPCPVEPLAQDFKEEDVKTTNHCAVCDRVFVSTNQWKSTCRCNNNSSVRGHPKMTSARGMGLGKPDGLMWVGGAQSPKYGTMA